MILGCGWLPMVVDLGTWIGLGALLWQIRRLRLARERDRRNDEWLMRP